jgi:hypothetical protein
VPWFPIIAEERDDAERALGIALPTRYCELLLDPRVSALLAHPSMGLLTPERRMPDFVTLTHEVRHTEPGFPADGVVATAPQGRYFRFWLPDPRDAGRLGDVRYTWDTVTHRSSRDSSDVQSVHVALQALHTAAPDAFTAVGYPPPTSDAPAASRVRVRASDESLRERLAHAPSPDQDDAWHTCGVLQVQGRYLTVADLGLVPDGTTQWALKVAPGPYAVTVRLRPSLCGEYTVVAAVRLLRQGCDAFEATHAAMIDVDLAAVVLHDRQAFFAQVPVRNREAVIDALLEVDERPCVVVLGHSAESLIVPSGDGDGSYPVYALTCGAECVGLEIAFPPPGDWHDGEA